MQSHRTVIHLLLTLLLLVSTLAAALADPVTPSAWAMPVQTTAQQPHGPDLPPERAEAPTVTIRGQVADATGAPAQRLRVRLMLADGTIAQETITDEMGTFAFHPQQTDGYQLWVLNEMGRPLTWEGDQLFVTDPMTLAPIDSTTTHPIRLHEALSPAGTEGDFPQSPSLTSTADRPPANTTAETAPSTAQSPNAGEIQGTVTIAETGEPAGFIAVRAYDVDGRSVSSDFTNSNGEYTVESLEAGTYYIQFQPSRSTQFRAYYDEFYNDKLSLIEADAIVVVTDQVVSGINATLERAALISGTVTTADTNLPMPDINVSLLSLDEKPVQSTTTDNNGRYQLDALPPDSYKLLFAPGTGFDRPDYLPEYFNDQVQFVDADTITLAKAETRVIDATLRRAGRIVGTVTDAVDGTPLLGIQVAAYDESATVVAQTTTSPSGTYTITGLATDNYRVRFEPAAFGENTNYLFEYHQDQPTLAAADTVAVSIGADTTVDAQLSPGGTINGQVTDQTTNEPITDIHVSAYDNYGILQASATTENDGTYRLNGLAGDTYWLYFTAPDDGTTAAYSSAHYLDSVTVTAPNAVNNLNMQLVQLGQISGRITAADSGTGLGDLLIQVYDEDGTFVGSVDVVYDGSYRTPGLRPGSYTLYAMPFPQSGDAVDYIAGFYNGKTTLLTADPVQVNNRDMVTDINIALTRGGQITGQVTAAADGTVLTDVTVALYDAAYQLRKRVDVGSDGSYTIPGLAAGTYYVHFVPDEFGDANAYSSIYYQGKTELATADPIQVAGAATVADINGMLPLEANVSGQITGRVTDEGTNLPLDNVQVRALDAGGRVIDIATTDTTGDYALTGLATGSYSVHFDRTAPNADGFTYAEEYYNDHLSLATSNPVGVTAPNVTANINAALTANGTISGRITAADTGGALPTQVLIYDSAGNQVASVVAPSNTGYYTSPDLLPGNYRLYFVPRGEPYRPAYSGNATTLADATSITVNSGQQTTDIDIALTQGGQISGHIFGADTGQPLSYVTVEIYDATTNTYIGETSTDNTGHYATFGLPNGRYRLRATGRANYLQTDTTPVTIAAATDRITLNVDHQRSATIIGRVMAETTQEPIGGVYVRIVECGIYLHTDFTNWLGLYELTGLSGATYTIIYETSGFDASAPYVTTTVAGVSVSPPTTLVRHQMLARGGQINGVVTAADTGQALADVYVYAYNEARELTRWIETTAVGSYALRGLPDGDYRLLIRPDTDGSSAAYAQEYYNDQLDFEQAQQLTISGANRLVDTHISLARGGRISGRLTASDSSLPLADVDVYARDENGFYWGFTESDRDGYFMTTGIPSGTYRLFFSPYYRNETAGYAYEYYNDQTTLAAGETINVTAPTLLSGHDAVLAPGARLGGIVTNKAGQPLDDVYINVYDSTDERVTYTYSESDGSYLTPGLPTGTYRLSFSSNNTDACDDSSLLVYYNGKADLAGADSVAVTAPTVRHDLNVTLEVTGSDSPTPTPTPGTGANKLYLPSVNR